VSGQRPARGVLWKTRSARATPASRFSFARAKQERADDQSPGRPTGIALAALSLALAQLTASDLWFSPGPKLLERSACYEHRHWQGGREQGDVA
jgi:hypothetical protein